MGFSEKIAFAVGKAIWIRGFIKCVESGPCKAAVSFMCNAAGNPGLPSAGMVGRSCFDKADCPAAEV